MSRRGGMLASVGIISPSRFQRKHSTVITRSRQNVSPNPKLISTKAQQAHRKLCMGKLALEARECG